MKTAILLLLIILSPVTFGQNTIPPKRYEFYFNNSLERHRDGITLEWDEMVNISEVSGKIILNPDSVCIVSNFDDGVVKEFFLVLDFYEAKENTTNIKYYTCRSSHQKDVVFIVIEDVEIGTFVRLDSQYIAGPKGQLIPLNVVAFNFDPDLKH